ncbi:MAG TPA: ABC transporter permease [bacterium]|nr:ABC transporter permease [bacterium]
MARFALHRLLLVVPTLVGMSVLIFAMVRLLPGDVVDAMLVGDASASAGAKQAVRKALGLADPLPLQYFRFAGGVVTGRLGTSLTSGEPVAKIMVRAIPITVELAALATITATAVGVPLGVVSAVRPNTGVDLAARVGGLVGLSLPNFWFATLALLVTSVFFHWIPPVTWIPPWQDPLGNLGQMALPALAIAVYLMAAVMRMTRASMLEVLRADYIRTARAKGAPAGVVMFRHALRNSLIPVITVIGFQVGTLMGGATIVEVIFGLPGMGYTLVQGIFTRDYTVIQFTALFLAAVFVIVNLCVDLLYGVLDPRIEQA